MLVKKFEAPTIKEALQMVKTQLGPEAIILATKDTSRGFGKGKGVIEVTAAISESQLKKFQFAESRVPEREKERLKASTAKVQRQFIQKSVDRHMLPTPTPTVIPATKPRVQNHSSRYIDIEDAEAAPVVEDVVRSEVESKKRVREAALSAKSIALAAFAEAPVQKKVPARGQTSPGAALVPQQPSHELLSLRTEVQQLRGLLDSFKSSPTAMMTFHPGAQERLPYETSFLFSRLIESGLSNQNAAAICHEALKELSPDQIRKKSLIDAWAVKHMMSQIMLDSKPLAGGLHLFAGSAGHGKTSMLVKMASQMVIRDQKLIAIVTADKRRVGAVEQLKIYSQILNVPFAIINDRNDWKRLLESARNLYAVLVDLPGLSIKNLQEIDYLKSLMPPTEEKRIVHLVQSVNQKDTDAFEIARRYRLLQFHDVMFTKLDESTNHGLIYNFQREFQIPLHSFGIGPMIPEDFEVATRERVIDLIFKISKLKTN